MLRRMKQIFKKEEDDYFCSLGSVTNIGHARTNNQDNLCFFDYVLPIDHISMDPIYYTTQFEETFCVALFDGMGGESYGEVASYIAAKTLYEQLKKDVANPLDFILDSSIAMNHSVYEQCLRYRVSVMGTTMAMLMFKDDIFYCCNVGDSKIYGWNPNELIQLSVDHTNEKLLRQLNVKNRKPSLTQYIGIPEGTVALRPSISVYPKDRFQRYLLCSDGLTDMVSQAEIFKAMHKRSIGDVITKLLNGALDNGGNDNISIIICDVNQWEDIR